MCEPTYDTTQIITPVIKLSLFFSLQGKPCKTDEVCSIYSN